MAVNSQFWRRFPVADRDQSFNADHAIKRIQNFTAGSVEAFNRAFLWRSSTGPVNNKNSYRLPIADIINNRMTLIPHAVFTAAAILSGAHGGLEGVVGEEEKGQLRKVVSAIYSMLRDAYGDPRVIPPWDRNDVPPQDRPNRQINASIAALPMAPEEAGWNVERTRKRLWQWADGDIRRYRKAFLWWDSTAPEIRSSYMLPVADIWEDELRLIPRAVKGLHACLENGIGLNVPTDDLPLVAAALATIGQSVQEDTMTTPAVLLRPPKEWFGDPKLSGPSRLTITADGRVSGHLALWNVCHFGIRDACRMAPRSHTDYRFFQDGTVVTADGSEQPVGRLTTGTGHADINLGYVAASDHYDNTGNAVAVVAAGEDDHGIWVAGALTPDATETQIAALRRSPLSGDWRPTRYGLELVAALAVNSPGFPVLGFTASGEQTLVAAGMVLTADEIEALPPQDEATGPDAALVERLTAVRQKAADLARKANVRRLNVQRGKGGQGGV